MCHPRVKEVSIWGGPLIRVFDVLYGSAWSGRRLRWWRITARDKRSQHRADRHTHPETALRPDASHTVRTLEQLLPDDCLHADEDGKTTACIPALARPTPSCAGVSSISRNTCKADRRRTRRRPQPTRAGGYLQNRPLSGLSLPRSRVRVGEGARSACSSLIATEWWRMASKCCSTSTTICRWLASPPARGDALKVASETNPSAIVADYQLPDMTGAALAARLRTNNWPYTSCS